MTARSIELDRERYTPCATCGHLKEMHMMVCGDRECECLCFIPAVLRWDDPELETHSRVSEVPWQETAIFAVLDLLLQEKEGEIFVSSKSGSQWKIKVSRDDTGYTALGVGKA